jgi:ATP-dependent Lon protease
MEKIAFKIVERGEDEPSEIIKVDQNSIEEFIGSPIFQSKKIYEQTPPGVVTGLAYNAYGGAILYIEAT